MKTFVFDLDDTLYDMTQPFKKAFAKHLANYNLDPDELFVRSRHYSDAIFPKVMSGEMSVDECGAYRIKRALEDYKIYLTQEEALAFQLDYRYNQGHITLSDTVKEMLSYVKDKAQIALYTNGVSEHQWKKLAGINLEQWMDRSVIFVSGDIGYAKPDVKGYELIEKKMNAKKEDLYFVGDSISMDMAGAKASGWKMVFVNRRNHDLSTSKYQPDYIVYSEEEMFACIKKIIEEA